MKDDILINYSCQNIKKIPYFLDLTGTLGDIYAFFVVTKENFVIRPGKMDMRNDKARHFR